MEKISGIYKIESKVKPDRIYIGSAININKRFSEHIWSLRKNKHHSKKLQRHYNKYGESDLQFSILSGCEKEELLGQEQFFIDLHNPYFNICPHAGNCLGKKHTPETIEKLRAIKKGRYLGEKNPNYGRHLSESAKQRIRESKLGKPSWNKGKKFSEEHKRNMSNAKKGNKYRLGIKLTDIEKQRIGESKIGNKYWLGRHHSDETKKKLSEASKRDWALKKLTQINSN